jgi:hypothetical protein
VQIANQKREYTQVFRLRVSFWFIYRIQDAHRNGVLIKVRMKKGQRLMLAFACYLAPLLLAG